MSKQLFHIKITFEQDSKTSSVLIFTAQQETDGAYFNVALDAKCDNLSAKLAKHLRSYINERLSAAKIIIERPAAKA